MFAHQNCSKTSLPCFFLHINTLNPTPFPRLFPPPLATRGRLSLPAFSASATSVSLENLSTISPSGVTDFDDIDDPFLLYVNHPHHPKMAAADELSASAAYLGVVDSFPSDAAAAAMVDSGASVATSAAAVTVDDSYLPMGEDPLEWLLENDSSIQQHLPESSLSAPMFPDFCELPSSASSSNATTGAALASTPSVPSAAPSASDMCYQSAGFVPLQPPKLRIGVLGHPLNHPHHPSYTSGAGAGTATSSAGGGGVVPGRSSATATVGDVADNLPYADPKVTVQSLFLVDEMVRDHEPNDIRMVGSRNDDDDDDNDGIDVDMEEASALLLP